MALHPKLYRDIEISSARSLEDLAEAITIAFDFEFDHPFGFYSTLSGPYDKSVERYESAADTKGGHSSTASAKQTTVAQAFAKAGKTLLFLFDYDEEWRFTVELRSLGKAAPETRFPRLLASVGDAPPQYPDLDDDDL